MAAMHHVAAPGGFWTGASRSEAALVGFLASESVSAGCALDLISCR